MLSIALVTGAAADEMNVAKKPQAVLLSDSDEEYQSFVPTNKPVDVSA